MVHSPRGVDHSMGGRPVEARRYRLGIFLVQGEPGTCRWLLVLDIKERLDSAAYCTIPRHGYLKLIVWHG